MPEYTFIMTAAVSVMAASEEEARKHLIEVCFETEEDAVYGPVTERGALVYLSSAEAIQAELVEVHDGDEENDDA
jgi:hypothetical protein